MQCCLPLLDYLGNQPARLLRLVHASLVVAPAYRFLFLVQVSSSAFSGLYAGFFAGVGAEVALFF